MQALVAATRHLATRADPIAMKAELTAAMDRQTIALIKWVVGLAVGFAALGLAVGFAALGLGMVDATITVLRWLRSGVQ